MQESRIEYLKMLQSTLSDYEKQASQIRAFALAITAGFFAAQIGINVESGAGQSISSWMSLSGVLVLFVLWYMDAHAYSVKHAYVNLFDQARTSNEVTFDMNADNHRSEGDAVKFMMRAPIMYLYGGVIIAVGLLPMVIW